MRGEVTPLIRQRSRDLLGYEIDTKEYRLMPYVHYVMMNEQRLDPARISGDERKILRKWKDAGYIEGGAAGLSMTKEFYEILCALLWYGYVAYRDEDQPYIEDGTAPTIDR
ncbi:MAG: hypothetical protein KGJ90_02465 [Patescibacteria group bacterium]|nr:hypothetical protein [Patescibacteria group bacterium]